MGYDIPSDHHGPTPADVKNHEEQLKSAFKFFTDRDYDESKSFLRSHMQLMRWAAEAAFTNHPTQCNGVFADLIRQELLKMEAD